MATKFSVGNFAGERPVDPPLVHVASILPGCDFLCQDGLSSQTPPRALFVHISNFQFRHVQPTGVFARTGPAILVILLGRLTGLSRDFGQSYHFGFGGGGILAWGSWTRHILQCVTNAPS